MQRTILATAMLVASCGQQPRNEVAATEPVAQPPAGPEPTLGNDAAAPPVAPSQAVPPIRVAAVDIPDCARLRDPCRMGARGTPAERCFELTGYLDDPNPAGRTVYAAPDAGSRRLGRVLPPFDPKGSALAASFEVIDGHDGWIRIEGAGDDPQLIETKPRAMYSGKGWIRGEGVSVTFQGSQLFAAPDWTSDMTVLVRTGFDAYRMTGLIGCDGSWAQGRWQIDDPAEAVRILPAALVSRTPLVVEGWATGACNIQETTCDGLFGDRPPALTRDAARRSD
jgi:hypothetical protein